MPRATGGEAPADEGRAAAAGAATRLRRAARVLFDWATAGLLPGQTFLVCAFIAVWCHSVFVIHSAQACVSVFKLQGVVRRQHSSKEQQVKARSSSVEGSPDAFRH